MRWQAALAAAAATVVLAAPGAARAEPWLDLVREITGLWSESQEQEVRHRFDQTRQGLDDVRALVGLYAATTRVVEQRVDVTASLGAGADRRDATLDAVVGVAYTARAERCDLLHVGASARGGVITADAPVVGSAQQWGALCLEPGISGAMFGPELAGLSLFPLRLREAAVIGATPRLTAPRATLDERYSEAGFGFDVEGARWAWRPGRGVAIAGFTADQRWRWSGLPGEGDARVELRGEMWFVRFYRQRGPLAPADRRIDVFAIGFHGIQADNGAAIVDAVPLRLTGIGVGQERVLLDLSLGFAGTGTITSTTSGPGVDDMTTIGTTGLPDVARTIARVAAYGGTPARAAAVAYDRTLDTNVLADVIVEDRGTAWLRALVAGGSARAAAFVSRATYFLDEDVVARERLVGASLDAALPVGRGLAVAVTVDASIGLGALDPALDGHAPARGVRALIELRAVRTPWRQVAPAPAPPTASPPP